MSRRSLVGAPCRADTARPGNSKFSKEALSPRKLCLQGSLVLLLHMATLPETCPECGCIFKSYRALSWHMDRCADGSSILPCSPPYSRCRSAAGTIRIATRAMRSLCLRMRGSKRLRPTRVGRSRWRRSARGRLRPVSLRCRRRCPRHLRTSATWATCVRHSAIDARSTSFYVTSKK